MWLDNGLAWAQGTYEYRPMGATAISATDLFRRRDFDPRRRLQTPATAEFAGRFVSLGHLNAHLRERRGKGGRPEADAARRYVLTCARGLMWGRLSACGGLPTRLPTSIQMWPRPIDNRPQGDNLPHIRRGISEIGIAMGGTAREC